MIPTYIEGKCSKTSIVNYLTVSQMKINNNEHVSKYSNDFGHINLYLFLENAYIMVF